MLVPSFRKTFKTRQFNIFVLCVPGMIIQMFGIVFFAFLSRHYAGGLLFGRDDGCW